MKIAQHKVQLLLCYIDFEIAKFSCSDTRFFSLYKCFVDPVVSWFAENSKCDFSFSWNLIGFFRQAIGCCILIKPHWRGKGYDLEQEMVRFVNKLD